jgi:transposase
LIDHFVVGAKAPTAATIVVVNKNTSQKFFHKLRDIIAVKQETRLVFAGEVEVDENYFGGYVIFKKSS